MFVAMPTAIPDDPLTSRRAVVVRPVVDRVLVDVAQQLGREAREARLGVAHRRGGVVVDRAEVPLALDERVALREVLREPDERVVDRLVAVRMEVPHHAADDVRALAERPVRLQPRLVHREQHAPVHRLEPVAHVRQRPPHDHAHRVIEVRRLHLLLEPPRLDGPARQLVNAQVKSTPGVKPEPRSFYTSRFVTSRA
jgi:hypothetical protein